MESEPSNDLNILILGETGVGKSTWINSFANFLKYRTLSKAKNNDLLSLIPSKFTIYDKDLNRVTVTTGRYLSEAEQNGQSATSVGVYTFKFKESMIRLIDTPGIGDTRGIDQDKKNFENILSTIQGFSVLHGICILLKPNESRLSNMFWFYIKDLLTHLHKDAVQNIIFCFTNSRGTFYRPGDTLNCLKDVLEEYEMNVISKNTVYCFDSEAYRFLAAVKNNPPVKFSREEKTNFKTSWESSASETKRLIDYIRSLPPHQLKSTLSMNNMRKKIFTLTKAMAEITRLCLYKINEKNQEEKEIRNLEASLFKQNGSSRVTVEDPRIRRLLDSQLQTKQLKENMLNEKNRIIIELQEKLQIIKDASVKFAYFLKSNVITPYNDKMEEYMGLLIKDEKFKIQVGCDSNVLKELEEHLNSYKIKKQNLETAIQSGAVCNDITLDEIEKVLKEVQTLKPYEEDIKYALDCVNLTAKNAFQMSLSSSFIIEMKETNDIQRIFKGLTACVF